MSFKGKSGQSNVHDSKSGYDLYAPYYDEDFKYLNGFEKDYLFTIIGDIKGKKVLDIGCGSGRLIGELKLFGAKVTACDISPEMVKRTREKFPNIEVVEGDIYDLPFKDRQFDMVIATFVIVHLRDLQKAFDEVYRVLKKGGQFAFTNINQRKAPKLKVGKLKEIVITSFYHRPQDVTKALEESFFDLEKEEFVYEDGVWINQILRAKK